MLRDPRLKLFAASACQRIVEEALNSLETTECLLTLGNSEEYVAKWFQHKLHKR
jgi:hypothetical protein